MEVGASFHSLGTRGLTFTDPNGGTDAADSLGSIDTVTLDARIETFLASRLYAGIDLGAGLGGTHSRLLRPSPPTTTQGSVLELVVGGLVGVKSPRLGPLEARAELLLGAYLLDVYLREQYQCGRDGCASLLKTLGVIEPRLALDAWVTPWITLGTWAGVDVVRYRDWSFGTSVTFHSRAFDRK
jgi:hypothetical protein